MNEAQSHLLATIEATIPDGHVPAYALGRRYAYCAVEALVGDEYDPSEAIQVGDVFLGPLIDVNDPEELRDFIAGLARGIESATTEREVAEEPARLVIHRKSAVNRGADVQALLQRTLQRDLPAPATPDRAASVKSASQHVDRA